MKPDITLIFPSSPFLLNQAVFPPLGILYLSAYLKSFGLDVQCLDMGLRQTPEMARADIIGISVTTPQRTEAFKLAKMFNHMGKKVIAGGPHATHKSQECLQYGFTHVVSGQGEITLMLFMSQLLKRHFDIPMEIPIDDFPFPDRYALPIGEYHYRINGRPSTPIMTSRGCPNFCSFCAKIDDNFRMQSAERTVAEIQHLDRKFGYGAFMIFDDVFIASKKRLRDIVGMIGGDYIFRCFARSNLLDDETCELLNRLGVVEVGIGIESGSDVVLKKNMKGTTRKMNFKAVNLLRKHGIRAKAFLIIGLPGETDETVVETASWIEEAKPDDVDFSVFQPMPGSKIFKRPEDWGISFDYDGVAGWYKGTPGEYQAVADTEGLTRHEIVRWRDDLEAEFKPKELLR